MGPWKSGWGAVCAALLVVTGCSGSPATITVSGEMRAVGGPYVVAEKDRPMVGTVSLVNLSTRRRYTTRTSADGRYSVSVPRGNYRAFGSSLLYASGQKDACSSYRTVVVAHTTNLDVACEEN